MNRVVKILIERDNIDREIAEALVRETRDELICLENPFEADQIIAEYLKLEPDYIFDILNF